MVDLNKFYSGTGWSSMDDYEESFVDVQGEDVRVTSFSDGKKAYPFGGPVGSVYYGENGDEC